MYMVAAQGRKALFAAPRRALPVGGTVKLRVRRGHAFGPDVVMFTDWLQGKPPTKHQVGPTSQMLV